MATPGELCIKTAEVLGLEPNTTATAWRKLRENGQVTVGGRGRSAAHCNARDASDLLIAATGKLPLTSIYQSWERYAQLPAKHSSLYEPEARSLHGNATASWQIGVPELDKLKANHSFRVGMKALMAAAVSGSLQQAVLAPDNQAAHRSRLGKNVEVRLHGPYPQAVISVRTAAGRNQEMHYTKMSNDISEILKGLDSFESIGDLHQIVHFGERTIFTIAEILTPSGD